MRQQTHEMHTGVNLCTTYQNQASVPTNRKESSFCISFCDYCSIHRALLLLLIASAAEMSNKQASTIPLDNSCFHPHSMCN